MPREDDALVKRFGEVARFPDLKHVVERFSEKNGFNVDDSCFDPIEGEWALVSYDGPGNLVHFKRGGVYPLGGFDYERDRFDEPEVRKFKRGFSIDGVLKGEYVSLRAEIFKKQIGQIRDDVCHRVDWANAEVTTTINRRDKFNYWFLIE